MLNLRKEKYLYLNKMLSARKIFGKAGASKISKNAEKKLGRMLEKIGVEIAKKAIKNTTFAGRKIIREEDVEE